MEFTQGESFDNIEASQGFAGQELLPPQWALATLTERTEFNYSGGESKSPRIHMHIQLDKVLAGSKGRTYFDDLYLTPKCQAMIDGWCKALGLGPFSHRFGPGRDGDNRPLIDPKNADMVKRAGEALANNFRKHQVIVAIDIEVDKKKVHPDKNRTTGWFSVDDDRKGALLESGFMGKKAIAVRERDGAGGKKERYFVANPQSSEASGRMAPIPAGTPSVVEA